MRIPGLWRIEQKIIDVQMQWLARKMDFEVSKNIIIFSDPRGGSTWVSEILSEITGYPKIWEPFHRKRVQAFKSLGFSWRPYIAADDEWEEAEKLFNKLLKGQILNHWITSETDRSKIKEAQAGVFKFVRANALLPWLVSKFTFERAPIHLLRHPFSVVSSQIKMGWGFNPDKFLDSLNDRSTYYTQYSTYIRSLKTPHEGLTAIWCMTNKLLLEHKDRDKKWLTLYYEDLVMDPKSALEKVLATWNLKYDLSRIEFSRASSTATKNSPLKGKEQLSLWQSHFTLEQIQAMRKVLEYFEIEEYKDSFKELP